MLKLRPLGADGKRTGMNVGLCAAFVALVVILNVVLYSVCTIYSLYFWVDDDAVYDIGDTADAYLSAINPEKKEVTVWFCQTAESLRKNRAYGRVLDTVEQFASRYGYVRVDYNNVFTDYARTRRWQEKNNGEAINEYSVVVECGENAYVATLTTFYVYQERDNNARMEYNGAETLLTLMHYVINGESTRPVAMFTTGHGEEATTSAYNLLVSAGFTIGTVDLGAEDLPDNCRLLVVAKPAYDFEDYNTTDRQFVSEIDKLDAFLRRGGTVLVLRAPENKNLKNLDRFLARHGLGVDGESVLTDYRTGVGSGGYLLLTDFADNTEAKAVAERVRTFNSTRFITGKASPIALLETDELTTVTPLLQTAPTACVARDGQSGESGTFPILAESTTRYGNGATSHLLLASSGDVMSYDMMETDGYANEETMYALLERYCGSVTPIGCPMLILNAYPVENLTQGEANLYFVLLTVVVPLLIAGAGVFVCTRRRYR